MQQIQREEREKRMCLENKVEKIEKQLELMKQIEMEHKQKIVNLEKFTYTVVPYLYRKMEKHFIEGSCFFKQN